jgi:hypothetical protein
MNIDELKREITEYREKLWDVIALNVESNLTLDKEEFLTYVANQLIEAEEIEDFEYVPHEGIGKQNRKVQIDGYAYSELDECLSIFVATPLTYDEEEVLTATEANKYIGRAVAFLENAEYISQTAEESSPGYGLAYDVIHTYGGIQKYKIYLISDREKSKNIFSIENIVIRGKEVECHIWDITRLYELSASAFGREEIVINLKDFLQNGIQCMLASVTEEYKAYLCNIPGIVLAQLYNKYGSRLLEGNVRSFLQVKGKVNKGIRATILNEPDMFFAYNNGIAATASNVKIETANGINYITEISSLQIVNGGQTTASLANALINDKKDNSEENIKKIFIPMKLSTVLPEKADKLIANIARYANSQNKVSDADLWSNHPFHIRMEEFSRRITAPATEGRQYGTYWYYERANGQYNQETYKSTPKEKERFEQHNPKSQKITKTDFAKYVHVYQQRPDISSAGGQKAFTKFADWAAKQWEKDNTVFNEEYFKMIVSVALLFKQSDKIVRKQEWYRSYKANITEYALAKIFYTVEKQYPDKAISYKSIWQKQTLSDAWVKQIEDAAYLMYQFLIREDRVIENVTEWAKREACWHGAKSLEYTLLDEFVAELQGIDTYKGDRKDAKEIQKLSDKLNFLAKVVEYGADNWTELLIWNESHRIMAPSEIYLVQLAKKMDGGLITSEKKCEKVLKILEKCRLEGFPK